MSKSKKKVGIFSFTCDEGCSIYLIEIFNKKLLEWLKKIELVYFLSVKDHTDIKDIDIAVVEGSITSEEDEKKIKNLRKNCKILIGMGNCTITGLPSCQRNSFDEKQLAEIKDEMEKFKFLPKCLAVKQVVKLDAEVPGCPMDEKKFIEIFEKYI
jgi:coenzyme F420-reducing hydrogenase gamma subunit